MPIRIDHEKTRAEIVEIVADVIAEEGVSAVTSRRVAEAAGASRAIVNTYFRDMRDLVVATFVQVSDRQRARVAAAEDSGQGLVGCIGALLPMDEARLRDWRVTIAFIGVALTDPDLYAIERARIDSAVAQFEQMLAREYGVRTSRRTRQAAQHVISAIIGVATHHCFHSNTVPTRAGQAQMIRSVLEGVELA